MIMRKAKRRPKATAAQRQIRPAEVLSSTVCWRTQRARRKERRGTRRGPGERPSVTVLISLALFATAHRDRLPALRSPHTCHPATIIVLSASASAPSASSQTLGLCMLVCLRLSYVLYSSHRSTARTRRSTTPALARCQLAYIASAIGKNLQVATAENTSPSRSLLQHRGLDLMDVIWQGSDPLTCLGPVLVGMSSGPRDTAHIQHALLAVKAIWTD
ncbi:hypothetical protein L226DRAFT_219708 [Lentinus tigrinus ALCF2SS1-7]|uniref:Uncharacterized protein n=1 Tax=Lentinus tigrinus ALCF2SS1-6 TaxID=1328759 RepID=A0A5C2S6R1_9APHY|nr:hypothetical protein L227DRAFT_159825 [Lentinus tigrinus ALCF2SS1-6]RPD70770.1 hypothetical protein L226DRAFT_219708 [Lentinus tigrinus ALCF2SS1-7]